MFSFLMSFFARPLVKKLLPWFLVAAALTVSAVLIQQRWTAYKNQLVEQGRTIGREEMATIYRNTVAENNKRNRSIDAEVAKGISDYAAKQDRERAERLAREQSAKTSIEKQIVAQPQFYTNPECTIPPEMIAERNRIRALGPN